MKAERSSKKIEKIYKPVDDKKSPTVIHVIKMNADDEIELSFLVEGEGELSESEFRNKFPDYEMDDEFDVRLNWDVDDAIAAQKAG